MANSYTQGLTREQIAEQIPQLEAQLAKCDNEDNRKATAKHLAALHEALEHWPRWH